MKPGGDTLLPTVVARWLTALALGAAHLALRPSAPTAGRHRLAAALIATAAPATLVTKALHRADTAWSPPRSATGRVLLAGYVGGGVLVEELTWRAPLLHVRPGRIRACLALVSAAGFGAVHLRRDGVGSAPVHLSNAVAWTVAALLGGRLRYTLVTHTLYNVAALSIRVPVVVGPSPAPDPPGAPR